MSITRPNIFSSPIIAYAKNNPQKNMLPSFSIHHQLQFTPALNKINAASYHYPHSIPANALLKPVATNAVHIQFIPSFLASTSPITINFPDSKLLQPISRTLVTAGLITTFLYPLEVLQTYSQTNTKYSFKTMPLIPLAKGFSHSLKSSTVKNSVLSNRDTVHTRVEEAIAEKEVVVDEKESLLKSKKSAIGSTIITSGIIGIFDTSATQYFANMKHLKSFEAANALTYSPQGITSTLGIMNKLSIAKMGITTRYLRNSINALCCIGSMTILKSPMDSIFPSDQYGITSGALTTIISGIAGGSITNGLEVIYKNQIKQANFVTMKTPSMVKITNELVANYGLKSIFKGYKYSIACAIMAYGTINLVDAWFDSGATITFNKNELSGTYTPETEMNILNDLPTLNTPNETKKTLVTAENSTLFFKPTHTQTNTPIISEKTSIQPSKPPTL